MGELNPVAVYVHVPFCPSKCGYCDFNSYAMHGEIVGRTVEATVCQILNSPHQGRPAKTVFFGGGTPTFIPAESVGRILQAVRRSHPIVEGAEISIESNPGTADAGKYGDLRAMGFNRLSMGAQSFDAGELKQLGRVHTPSQVARAMSMAREAGFKNVGLDLMLGLPGQSLERWRRNLKVAFSLGPEHLSLYALTIEPDTRFHSYHERGMLDLPDDEEQVEMLDLAAGASCEAGFVQYEISNYAKPGFECAHNQCYWLGEEYLGYGPGAVGMTLLGQSQGRRTTNYRLPDAYCEAVESKEQPFEEEESLDSDTLRFERLMLGIRMNAGIDTTEIPVASGAIERLLTRGLIERDGQRIRLSQKGRHFCSDVAVELA